MTNTVTPQPIVSKRTFVKQELNLFPADGLKNKAHKINPGVHKWPFRFQIPSDTDESVEGLVGNYIFYNLNATVDRGYISKQISATKHVRVVRTLGQDSMESLPMEQVRLQVELQLCMQLTGCFTDQRRHLGFKISLQDHRPTEKLHRGNRDHS